MFLFLLLVLNAANSMRATGKQASAWNGKEKTSTAQAALCSERELHPLSSQQTAEKTTVNRY